MPRLNLKNNSRTTLSAGITSTVTSFDVANGGLLPDAPFRVTVDNEIMEIGTKSGNTLSDIIRGMEGTTAVSHNAGAYIEVRFTAGVYEELETAEGAQEKVDNEIEIHQSKSMPHIMTDLRTGKTYRYGYQISAGGIPQLISEEVI